MLSNTKSRASVVIPPFIYVWLSYTARLPVCFAVEAFPLPPAVVVIIVSIVIIVIMITNYYYDDFPWPPAVGKLVAFAA